MSGYTKHPRLKPFDLERWIDDRRDLLKPPVGNRLVFEEAGMVVTVVGGVRTSGWTFTTIPSRSSSTSSKAT